MKRLLLGRETALLGILLLLLTGFSATVPGFLDARSLLDHSRYWVVPGMLAIPMTFIIATAGIDLSVGSMVALCGIVLGLLVRDAAFPLWAACLSAVAVGTLAGAINGGVSSFLAIPPLVVTLATMTLYRGLAMGLSRGGSVSNLPEGLLWLGSGHLMTLPLAGGALEVPVALAMLLVMTALGVLLLRRSWIGRYSEAIGENETAAVFAAIPVKWLKAGLYTASGAVCGIGALVHVALYNTAKADAATGMELEAIACVVLGGTRISGGHGSVLGTLLGLFIIGILRYGLDLAGMPRQYIIIVMGVLLIVTVVLNEWTARLKGVQA